jgi:hypothetical protein
MIYTLYFLYRYCNSIYYILCAYHSYRISYDIYNGGTYIYNKIPLMFYNSNQISVNGFEVKEVKNKWQYIDIY